MSKVLLPFTFTNLQCTEKHTSKVLLPFTFTHKQCTGKQVVYNLFLCSHSKPICKRQACVPSIYLVHIQNVTSLPHIFTNIYFILSYINIQRDAHMFAHFLKCINILYYLQYSPYLHMNWDIFQIDTVMKMLHHKNRHSIHSK